MKIYISTPINARREATFQEKRMAAAHRCERLKKLLLTEFDAEIVTPFDVIPLSVINIDEEEAMGKCVAAVLKCDAIYLDHGWNGSKGCNLEYRAAVIYGKKVFEHDKM